MQQLETDPMNALAAVLGLSGCSTGEDAAQATLTAKTGQTANLQSDLELAEKAATRKAVHTQYALQGNAAQKAAVMRCRCAASCCFYAPRGRILLGEVEQAGRSVPYLEQIVILGGVSSLVRGYAIERAG